MATDQPPVTEPTERQRASIARAILQMGDQRYTFRDTIREHIKTMASLSKQAEDLRTLPDRLKEMDDRVRAVISPEKRTCHDNLKKEVAKSGRDWKAYLVEKYLEQLATASDRARFYELNPGKPLPPDHMLKNYTSEALKRRASVNGREVGRRTKPPYKPLSSAIDECERKYGPYRARLPAFIAQLVQLREAMAKLPDSDGGCDFIDQSIVLPLERATRERDLRIAAHVCESLEAIAAVSVLGKEELKNVASPAQRQSPTVPAKKRGQCGASGHRQEAFRKAVEQACRSVLKLPKKSDGTRHVREDIASALLALIPDANKRLGVQRAGKLLGLWEVTYEVAQESKTDSGGSGKPFYPASIKMPKADAPSRK